MMRLAGRRKWREKRLGKEAPKETGNMKRVEVEADEGVREARSFRERLEIGRTKCGGQGTTCRKGVAGVGSWRVHQRD